MRSTTDFSVKPCLDGKAPSAFAETLRAMRTEVVEDIKQMKWEFFRASTHPERPCHPFPTAPRDMLGT
jgi:hypothetical protein